MAVGMAGVAVTTVIMCAMSLIVVCVIVMACVLVLARLLPQRALFAASADVAMPVVRRRHCTIGDIVVSRPVVAFCQSGFSARS